MSKIIAMRGTTQCDECSTYVALSKARFVRAPKDLLPDERRSVGDGQSLCPACYQAWRKFLKYFKQGAVCFRCGREGNPRREGEAGTVTFRYLDPQGKLRVVMGKGWICPECSGYGDEWPLET